MKRKSHKRLATINLHCSNDCNGNPYTKTETQLADNLTIKDLRMIISALDDATIPLRRVTAMMPPVRKLYFGLGRNDPTARFAVVIDWGDAPRASELFDALRLDIVLQCGMRKLDEDLVVPLECLNIPYREADLYARVPELALT